MNETQSESIIALKQIPVPVPAAPAVPVPAAPAVPVPAAPAVPVPAAPANLITLVLTADEANALSNLLDGAVKAHGIPAAVAAVPLFFKLREAAQAAKS
jgi:hypothetical protein